MSASARPRAVVQEWLARFNAGDAAGIAALYADDAVNHQVALAPVIGRTAIAQMHADLFESTVHACIPVATYEDGEWAALEWRDPEGMRGCGFFHIRDGKIVEQRGYWDTAMMERIHPANSASPQQPQ